MNIRHRDNPKITRTGVCATTLGSESGWYRWSGDYREFYSEDSWERVPDMITLTVEKEEWYRMVREAHAAPFRDRGKTAVRIAGAIFYEEEGNHDPGTTERDLSKDSLSF